VKILIKLYLWRDNHSIRAISETLKLTPSDASQLFENPGETLRSKTVGPDMEPLRLSANIAFLPGLDDTPLVMIVGADSRPASRAILKFVLLSLGLMLLAITGVITAVYMQVSVGLKPLFNLRDQVVDVKEGREVRLTGNYPREIYPLANELNGLIDHNSDVVKRARTHVSNLAHALKTPIAVLQNESQQQKGALSNVVKRQTEMMKNQVDHHLQRARAAATGQKRDLDEMLGNLIDNAFKWTRSEVFITAQNSQTDTSMLDIIITDNGPGIKPEDFAKALQRGVRLDEATPGTGFGLAIIDDLARAYKGSFELGVAPSGGLATKLTLPRRVGGSANE